MIFIKKANLTTMTTTEIFKCYKNSTLSDAQNAGNRIFELLDFKYLLCVCVCVGGGGGVLPGFPRGKGPCGSFSGHSCLLHLQWPLITKVIEKPCWYRNGAKFKSSQFSSLPSRVISYQDLAVLSSTINAGNISIAIRWIIFPALSWEVLPSSLNAQWTAWPAGSVTWITVFCFYMYFCKT